MRAITSTLSRKPLSFFLLSLVFNSVFADGMDESPVACHTSCTTPYGEVLGASSGEIQAFSNCQPGCINPEVNHWNGTYTGIKWQCVEYARRWLLVQKGLTYGNVETASDIWNEIDHLIHVKTNRNLPLESHVNGSTQAPQIGDLLIYARAFHGTGHVAVITRVDHANGLIEVGEQNYSNQPWSRDYARKIDLIRRGDSYWLLDGYLIGWKHAPVQEQPG